MRIFTIFIALCAAAPGGLRDRIEPFLEKHCYECHDDFDEEGGLNLLDLKWSPDDEENRRVWEKVVHRVETGEMPPKKTLPEKERASLVEGLEPSLIEAGREELEKTGRVQGRRLTATEYEKAVQDLLGVHLPLADELTADAGEGFATHAESQQLSHFHLDRYLRVGGEALAEAFERATEGDEKYFREYSAEECASPGRGNDRGPQLWKGKAISWYSRMQFAGRIVKTKVGESGWYRIAMHDLEAVNPGADGYTWGTLETGSGYSNEPLLYPLGLIEATSEPRTFVFEGWIKKGHLLLLKPDEAGLKRIPARGGTFRYEKKDYEKAGYPGLRFGKIVMERIHPGGGRDHVREQLFGDLDPFDPRFDPEAALPKLIRRFAERAFRRPVTRKQIAPYLGLAQRQRADGRTFAEALKSAYHAVLCSPRFLTFVEEPGWLDDHALAARLSFLLWKTVPDAALRRLADEEQLRNPEVLSAQIDRLLRDERSHRFVGDFTDQWLNLRAINDTQPDPRRFGDFDPPLQRSLKSETRAFVAELIAEDRAVTEFLKSDVGFLNTRLRDHYRLDDVSLTPGGGLQKVKLRPNHRSGLPTQASILKVTADGSVTSPVLRGVWVNERILGRHIPPPPENIPAIEPDIRGAVSIRDQLEKHTKSTSCASCHRKIDPSGFALESFDPVGQFREAYGKKKDAARVDPSGVTPDGVGFADYEDWRRVYLRRPDLLARAFAVQILEYGTGGEMRFADRPHLDKIVAQAGRKKFGIREIIRAALTSEIFLTK